MASTSQFSTFCSSDGLTGCLSYSRWYLHHPRQDRLSEARLRSRTPDRQSPAALTFRLRHRLSPGFDKDFNGHRDKIFQECGSDVVTKFIDDHLVNAVRQKDGEIRQIVLLTDGMDQRPYRLPWPPLTMIFILSSGPFFQPVKGAKLPKNCLFRRVSTDFGEAADLGEGWTERLRGVGYQGDKPSIWAMQGLDFLKPSTFQYVLMCVGRSAMKGSSFVGEIPIAAIDCPDEETGRQWLEKTFLRFGLASKFISFRQLAQDDDACDGVYFSFLAEQLRLSDEQVIKAMREIELTEEAGEEETFEDW